VSGRRLEEEVHVIRLSRRPVTPVAAAERAGRRRHLLTAVVVTLALPGLVGCQMPWETSPGASDAPPAAPLVLWAHRGNAAAESQALQATVRQWNLYNPSTPVEVEFFDESGYSQRVASTPLRELPDILEVDGPTVAAHVRAGRLLRLDDLLSNDTLDNMTPTAVAQGTVRGRLYAVAQFGSAIGVFANKRLLRAAGVSYPESLDDAWSDRQFLRAVDRLARSNRLLPGKAIDLKLNYSPGLDGEFGTFAFTPVVWSAGGDLLRDGRAEGAINSSETVDALTMVAALRPYTSDNADDKDFVSGRVPLSWVGHWAFADYREALGDDLLALPLPDLGRGPKTGAGSWAWGIPPTSRNPDTAARFLELLLSDAQIARIVSVNGAPPATFTALDRSNTYGQGSPLNLWGQLGATAPGVDCAAGQPRIPAACGAITRPVTAGYPVVTEQFGGALAKIFDGADPRSTLDDAAQAIDTDFRVNAYDR
jgi:multiple sugar transport system substrate-binding protein